MKNKEKEAEEAGFVNENFELGPDFDNEEDDGLDDWGNEAEVYEANGIKVYAYRYPIVGMRLGAKNLQGHTASRDEPKFYQWADFLSVMSDGQTFAGDSVPSSDMFQSKIFPAPPNSYHVTFYAPEFEDLIIGDTYEFNGIRGSWHKHVQTAVEGYIRDHSE